MDNPAGWIASAFTLATFVCCQGRALRLCALAANAAFIVYGTTAHLWPVLALHAILVPINLWRLSQLCGNAHARGVAPIASKDPSCPRPDPINAEANDPRQSRSTLLQGANPRNRSKPSMTIHPSVSRRGFSRLGMPLALAALLALAACGSGEEFAAVDPARGTVTPPVDDSAAVTSLVTADGSVLPTRAQAWRTNGSVRTNQQLYATRAQSAALEEALQGEILMLQVDWSGAAVTEHAVNIAFFFQVAHNLSNDVPVLMQGSDLWSAADAVDRPAAGGMSHVWLVTQ